MFRVTFFFGFFLFLFMVSCMAQDGPRKPDEFAFSCDAINQSGELCVTIAGTQTAQAFTLLELRVRGTFPDTSQENYRPSIIVRTTHNAQFAFALAILTNISKADGTPELVPELITDLRFVESFYLVPINAFNGKLAVRDDWIKGVVAEQCLIQRGNDFFDVGEANAESISGNLSCEIGFQSYNPITSQSLGGNVVITENHFLIVPFETYCGVSEQDQYCQPPQNNPVPKPLD